MRQTSLIEGSVEPEPGSALTLKAWLLGRARLIAGGAEVLDNAWTRRSGRSLLLLLLATPGHRLPRDLIIDRLWPEAKPSAGLSSYYQAVRALRMALEPHLPPQPASSFITVERNGVTISPQVALWVDVDAFETASQTAAGSTADRRDHLRAAVSLYAGDLLADEPALEWMTARREGLHLDWQRVVFELAELDRFAGDPLATVTPLKAIVAADPTQEEAHRALIRAFLEAGQHTRAVRQYEQCRRALRDELGLEPSQATRQFIATTGSDVEDKVQGSTASLSLSPPQRLPIAPTSLVGRDDEIERLLDLVQQRDVRLVTLTGPGGVGKTRLAIEVSTQLDEEFAHGAVVVALASISRPEHLLPTVVMSLGLREVGPEPLTERLRGVLHDRELLLVLDNFEHVAAAAPQVAALLGDCPQMKVVVTSRVPLHLRGERLFEVPPLTPPPMGGRSSFTAIRRSEAVRLFVERAGATHASFQLTEENAGVVAAVCDRLDGLPLAIELAAARSRLLSPDALLARLDSALDLLTGGPRDHPIRLRTMRDAIAWSYDLLDEEQQALFRRLAVFVGGCTLAAAEAVSRGVAEPRLLDLIAALVDHSLLHRSDEVDGEPRYAMLETIREYGLEQLAASGELEAVRRRHAAYLIAWGETLVPRLAETAQVAELDRLGTEIGNVRAALAWALDRGETETVLRLVVATFSLWLLRANASEGRQLLETALAMGGRVVPTTRAEALCCASSLASLQGDYPHAALLAEQSLAVSRAHGHQRCVASAMLQLGLAAEWQGDLAGAAACYEEALDSMRDRDEPFWVALFLSNLGDVTLWQGDVPRAAAFAEAGLARWREMGNDWGIALGLGTAAAIASEQEDQPRAVRLYEESLSLYMALGDRRGIAGTLAGLAGVAAASGLAERAARLLGAARALGDAIGVAHLAHHVQYERSLAATRARLDEQSFATAWAAGRALPLEGVVAEAAAVAPTPAIARPGALDAASESARMIPFPVPPRSRRPRRG